MNSGEVKGTETVFEMFLNANLGVEPINLDFAKKWVEESIQDGKISDRLSCHLAVTELNRLSCSVLGTNNFRLLETLNCHREKLVSMLVYLKYTWFNANLIIDTFLDSIESYELEFQVNPCSFYSFTYCEMFSSDMLLNVRLIAKSFFNGKSIIIKCSEADSLLPFYLYLADLLKNIMLDISHPSVEKVKNDDLWRNVLTSWKLCDNLKSWESRVNELKNNSCPMIITEDADIDAAVDNFKKSICQTEVQCGSSVSHVLIEESIYQVTVLLLENSLKRIRHGSRFDKRTELELLDYEPNVDSTSYLNLKVFSPCDKSPIKLCLGWNPKDIDNSTFSKDQGFIPIIPYRNLSELKSLIKDLFKNMICPASIWCENIAAIKFQYDFEFSPLWINCHGSIHPLFPHYNRRAFSTAVGLTEKSVSKPNNTDALLDIISNAQGAISALEKCNFDKLKSLLDFMTSSNSCTLCRKCGSFDLVNRDRVIKLVQSNLACHLRLASKPLITSSIHPVGVILIFCSDISVPSFSISLQKIVTASLINGNSVIIIAKDDSSIASCHQVTGMFNPLPKNVLSFYVGSDFNFNSILKKSNYKCSCKCIFLSQDIFILNNLYDYSFLLNVNGSLCNEVLFDLTSRIRSVWTS